MTILFSIVGIIVGIIIGILALFKLFTFISRKTNRLTKEDVIKFIKDFNEGTGGERDWDGFISAPIYDNELDAIRLRCGGLPEEFPPTEKGHYCNEEGFKVLEEFVSKLEKNSEGV